MSMCVIYLLCIAPSLWYLNTLWFCGIFVFHFISGPFAPRAAQYKGAALSFSLLTLLLWRSFWLHHPGLPHSIIPEICYCYYSRTIKKKKGSVLFSVVLKLLWFHSCLKDFVARSSHWRPKEKKKESFAGN